MSQTIAPVLGEATVQELREAVRGAVLAPSDDGYEEAYPAWNGMHDGQRPALIVRCRGNADVIAAIGFARANDLTIAVRGGGHSVAGLSTTDGGLVVELAFAIVFSFAAGGFVSHVIAGRYGRGLRDGLGRRRGLFAGQRLALRHDAHFGAVGGFEIDDIAQQNLLLAQFIAPHHDGLERQRAFAEAADHRVAAGLDALGDGDFAFAAKQFDAAHFA